MGKLDSKRKTLKFSARTRAKLISASVELATLAERASRARGGGLMDEMDISGKGDSGMGIPVGEMGRKWSFGIGWKRVGNGVWGCLGRDFFEIFFSKCFWSENDFWEEKMF